MKKMLLVLSVVACSCSPTQKKTTEPATDETGKVQNPTLEAIPVCISQMIAKHQKAPKTNPPKKIFSYTYKGKTVYYETAICCDQYSNLYDENCKLIGHPDGGITGKGDGTLTDFSSTKTNEQLLWEDKR